jgi:alkanesulfonate monooxygenase SsuD/methylene tetrahydromethanopterin reductase-like flavin-dependent oxidoreductase (luciferase family)
MHLGLGLITAQHHPDDARSDVERYREAIQTAVDAERLGFESIWTSEHHFVDDAYMSSQLPVLAAMAARTERILLGTGVLLAPMFDPLRLAEDAATVDLISAGRLILGLGIGWRREEFDGFGAMAAGHKGDRLDSIVTVLRQAWSDGLTTGDERGLYRYLAPGLNVTPKPARAGGPPIWIGAGAEVAIRRAGRIADGLFAGEETPESLGRQLDLVREEAAAAGRDPSAVTPAVYVTTFAWRDGDPWQTVRDDAHYGDWKYDDMAGARGSRETRLPPPLTAEAEALLRDRTIVGTPDEVTDRIGAFRDVLGPDGHFVARSWFPGLDPSIQADSIALLGEEVRPALA